jgi:hypothetical protein
MLATAEAAVAKMSRYPSVRQVLFVAWLCGFSSSAAVAADAALVNGALLPIPAAMRDRATVVLDVSDAKRVILRQGNNGIICKANTLKDRFFTECYPQELDAFWTRNQALGREGKTGAETTEALVEDVRAGRLKTPSVGVVTYEMGGDSPDSALPHMIVFLPNATSKSSGLPDKSDPYRPWLMWAGTPFAHVMVPGK